MQQIAQAAGVNKKQLYQYYGCKQDLLVDLLLDQQWMLAQFFEQSSKLSEIEFLEGYFLKLGQNLGYFKLMLTIKRFVTMQQDRGCLFDEYKMTTLQQQEALNQRLKLPSHRHLFALCWSILEGSAQLKQDKFFLQFAPTPSFYEQLIKLTIESYEA